MRQAMTHPMHQQVAELTRQAIDLMDAFMRDKIDLKDYAQRLRQNPGLVHYLNALMMLSSLQQELDFQVAEYGANVASEDIRMLKDLLLKFD
jgi:hypothetical protein